MLPCRFNIRVPLESKLFALVSYRSVNGRPPSTQLCRDEGLEGYSFEPSDNERVYWETDEVAVFVRDLPWDFEDSPLTLESKLVYPFIISVKACLGGSAVSLENQS